MSEAQSVNVGQCKSCQSTNTVCVHEEAGGALAFLDVYSLVCKDCGSIDHQHLNGGDYYDNCHTNCPFCNVSSEFHRPKPSFIGQTQSQLNHEEIQRFLSELTEKKPTPYYTLLIKRDNR